MPAVPRSWSTISWIWRRPDAPIGSPLAEQSAVGVHREPAADLGGALGDEAFLLAVLAEAVLRHVDDLRPGVGVLELGDVDVLGADARRVSNAARDASTLGLSAASLDRERRALHLERAESAAAQGRGADPYRVWRCTCGARSARHITIAAAPSFGPQYMY